MASIKEGRKNTGLYWNFLEKVCFKVSKNTLHILEKKKWGTGILLNILDYTGIFLKKTSGHPDSVKVPGKISFWPFWVKNTLHVVTKWCFRKFFAYFFQYVDVVWSSFVM